MAFPKNSHFDRGEHESAFEYMSRVADGDKTDRKGNFVKTASIPVDELERWIDSLELAENGGDVQDVVFQMRSYFSG